MTLIDTSSWIQFLRKDGNLQAKGRVAQVLEEGSAVTCPIVIAELWMGAGSGKDQSDVTNLQSVIPCLSIGKELWKHSYELAKVCRRSGTPVPASDLIIAACAFFHGARIEAVDKHFSVLENYRQLIDGGIPGTH